MLREFIQCKNTEERLSLLAESNANAWEERELDILLEILGISAEEDMNKESKFSMAIAKLIDNDCVELERLDEEGVFKDANEKAIDPGMLAGVSELKGYLRTCRAAS